MRCRRPSPAIPACRWAWRTSRPCCSREVLRFDAADARLAEPRPLRAVGRPRLDAALCAALSHRLSRHGDRRAEALPPARLQDRRPSRVRPCRRHRDDHRSARPGPRQRRRHGAGRAPAQRAARRRHHRSPHLRHRRRRLPDGRHQPRGDLARRAPRPRQADRAVRRQRHLHRRPDQPVGVRRPGRALQGLAAGTPWRSTATIPQPIAAALAKATRRLLEALADRLQDDHRLRRADQGRQGVDARRAARRPKRSRARARSSAWPHAPFEIPDAGAARLARRRTARRRGAHELEVALGASRPRRCGRARASQPARRALPASPRPSVPPRPRPLAARQPSAPRACGRSWRSSSSCRRCPS